MIMTGLPIYATEFDISGITDEIHLADKHTGS